MIEWVSASCYGDSDCRKGVGWGIFQAVDSVCHSEVLSITEFRAVSHSSTSSALSAASNNLCDIHRKLKI